MKQIFTVLLTIFLQFRVNFYINPQGHFLKRFFPIFISVNTLPKVTVPIETSFNKIINGMNPGASPGPRFRSKLRGIYRERFNSIRINLFISELSEL